MFDKLMRKIVKCLDPKFEKYRANKTPAPKYSPKTL